MLLLTILIWHLCDILIDRMMEVHGCGVKCSMTFFLMHLRLHPIDDTVISLKAIDKQQFEMSCIKSVYHLLFSSSFKRWKAIGVIAVLQ